MSNFWDKLPFSFTVLAPMEDVTDVVFREIIRETAAPDVFFTEFTSADGLASVGHDRVVHRLRYTEKQRPVVAQIWGIHPEAIEKAAAEVQNLGFDGVDINMGCPVPAVTKVGAGAAMCLNHKLAGEVIAAAKKGAPHIPVSVKTRLGMKTIDTENWVSFLLSQNIANLTLHGRTGKQQSEGDANWDEISKAVHIRNEIAPKTTIVGNGDVKNRTHAEELCNKFETNGAMIGRGIFLNPWAFSGSQKEHSQEEYLDLLIKHLNLFEETWGTSKNFAIMKKFFKMYVSDFPNAHEVRATLMAATSPHEVRAIIASLPKN